MEFEFKAEDFATEYGDLLAREAADIANAKLREWLAAAPVRFHSHRGNLLDEVPKPLNPEEWIKQIEVVYIRKRPVEIVPGVIGPLIT
jgi:hypothetical protein